MGLLPSGLTFSKCAQSFLVQVWHQLNQPVVQNQNVMPPGQSAPFKTGANFLKSSAAFSGASNSSFKEPKDKEPSQPYYGMPSSQKISAPADKHGYTKQEARPSQSFANGAGPSFQNTSSTFAASQQVTAARGTSFAEDITHVSETFARTGVNQQHGAVGAGASYLSPLPQTGARNSGFGYVTPAPEESFADAAEEFDDEDLLEVSH
jgi:hypothetical protein